MGESLSRLHEELHRDTEIPTSTRPLERNGEFHGLLQCWTFDSRWTESSESFGYLHHSHFLHDHVSLCHPDVRTYPFVANMVHRFENLRRICWCLLCSPVGDEFRGILFLLWYRRNVDYLRSDSLPGLGRWSRQYLYHRSTLRESENPGQRLPRATSRTDDQPCGSVDSLDSHQWIDCVLARLIDTDACRPNLLSLRIHGCLHWLFTPNHLFRVRPCSGCATTGIEPTRSLLLCPDPNVAHVGKSNRRREGPRRLASDLRQSLDTDGPWQWNHPCLDFLHLRDRYLLLGIGHPSHTNRSRSETIHAERFLCLGLFLWPADLSQHRSTGLFRCKSRCHQLYAGERSEFTLWNIGLLFGVPVRTDRPSLATTGPELSCSTPVILAWWLLRLVTIHQ